MRYRATGQLDDPSVQDGDELWNGVITASDPQTLKKGKLAAAVNVRLDRGPAETRKGHSVMLGDGDRDVILGSPPVDLLDAAPYSNSGLYDTPSSMDAAMVATSGDAAYIWERDDTSDASIETVTYSSYHTPVPGSVVPQGHDAIRSSLNLPKAHIQETFSPTVLFSTAGPVLPFTTPVTTAVLPLPLPFVLGGIGTTLLGNPVLRYSGMTSDLPAHAFRQFKEMELSSVDPTTREVTTVSGHAFAVGEVVHIQEETPYTIAASTWTGDWTVESVTGTSFVVKEATAGYPAALPAGYNAVYSMEDQCPPAEFAAWAGNRLFVPTGASEIRISDPLSTHVFPVLNRLQIASEESGKITALAPMGDDAILVFKDHSIHLIQDVSDNKNYDPATDDQLKITRITNQLGCSSRKTVQVVGDEVLFFSPHGLYGLALNAKGQGAVGLPPQAVRVADFPLSREIDDVIESVDFTYAEDFTASFNRGRYYLQVRLHSGEWRVLIYNTLLKGWEGHDTADTTLKKLFSMNDEGKARLIALTTNGALVRWEDSLDGRDYYGNEESNAYESSITTREYDMETGGINRFRRIVTSWEPLPFGPSYTLRPFNDPPEGWHYGSGPCASMITNYHNPTTLEIWTASDMCWYESPVSGNWLRGLPPGYPMGWSEFNQLPLGWQSGIKVMGRVFNPDTEDFDVYEVSDQSVYLPVVLPFLLGSNTPDDHYRRDSIRKRGEKISFTITNNSKGRMRFQFVQVEGTTAHRRTINYE